MSNMKPFFDDLMQVFILSPFLANSYMSWRGAKRRGHLIHFLLPLMVKILIVEIASLRPP